MLRLVPAASATLLFALCDALQPAIALATTSDSYTATYEYRTPFATTRIDETLTLRRSNGAFSVIVTDTHGALLSLPTELSEDGEILADASDPGVVCYNMSMSALYRARRTPERPEAVAVRFGTDIVQIPLSLAAKATAEGVEYAGSGNRSLSIADGAEPEPLDMLVAARLRVARGSLSDAVFTETTTFGSPARTGSSMTCNVKRRDATQDVPPAQGVTAV